MDMKQFEVFKKVGCKTDKEAALLQQIYMELTEVKKYWDVECKFNSSIEQAYITAKKSKTSRISVFIPIPISTKLNMRIMLKYINICPEIECTSIYLVLCSSDSTSVYYEISEGIGELPKQSANESKENVREKLDKELLRNKSLLEQAAMYGLPVTIPKNKST